MLPLLFLLLGLLLTLRLAQDLKLRQRLLDRLCDRVVRLHMRHLMSGIVQRAFHHEDVLALSHGFCVLAQYDVVDPR